MVLNPLYSFQSPVQPSQQSVSVFQNVSEKTSLNPTGKICVGSLPPRFAPLLPDVSPLFRRVFRLFRTAAMHRSAVSRLSAAARSPVRSFGPLRPLGASVPAVQVAHVNALRTYKTVPGRVVKARRKAAARELRLLARFAERYCLGHILFFFFFSTLLCFSEVFLRCRGRDCVNDWCVDVASGLRLSAVFCLCFCDVFFGEVLYVFGVCVCVFPVSLLPLLSVCS